MTKTPRRVSVRRIARWTGAVLAVLSFVVVATNLWVVRKSAPFLNAPEHPPNTVIVPGAYVRGLEPSPTLADRLQCAKDLLDSGSAEHVLLSGDHGQEEYDEVAAMQAWLLAQGVDASQMTLDHAGFRTLDTMERAKRVFGVERAYVCTQDFHLNRAVFLARRAGIEAYGVPADKRTYRGHQWNLVRESVARTVAFFDSYILGTTPRYL